MQQPLQIVFRNLEHSNAIEQMIREKAAKLEQFADRIMNCRVVVEVPHRHHEHGNQYQVRIDLTVPGGEIVVNREPPQHTEYRDLSVAIRDAFDAAKRQLADYVRQRRGFVKTHEALPCGRVTRLFPGQDYGFLTTADGRDIYFHRHSVVEDAFERLSVGAEVMFAEAAGENGPQASTVRPTGRHHRV